MDISVLLLEKWGRGAAAPQSPSAHNGPRAEEASAGGWGEACSAPGSPGSSWALLGWGVGWPWGPGQ